MVEFLQIAHLRPPGLRQWIYGVSVLKSAVLKRRAADL
jgi:hypothetical protein